MFILENRHVLYHIPSTTRSPWTMMPCHAMMLVDNTDLRFNHLLSTACSGKPLHGESASQIQPTQLC